MTSKSSRQAKPEGKTVTFSPYIMRRHRDRLASWLDEIGVDPNTVSVDYPIRVAGSKVMYSALVLDSDDEALSQATAGRVLVVERSCPCSAAPPDLHSDAVSEFESD